MTPDWVVFIRFLIFILTAELAVRCAVWVRRLNGHGQSEPLYYFIVGSTFSTFGTAISIAHSVFWHAAFKSTFWDTLPQIVGGLAFATGTLFCLISCWKISCGLSNKVIIGSIAVHVALAYAVAVAFRVWTGS